MKNLCRGWRQLFAAISTLSILALAGSAAGLLGWLFYSLDTPIGIMVVKDFLLQVNEEQHHLIILSPTTDLPVLRGTLANSLSIQTFHLRSSSNYYVHISVGKADLKISALIEETVTAYTIQWTYNKNEEHFIQDCFSLRNALWFATPSGLNYQNYKYSKPSWPLQNLQFQDKLLLPSLGKYTRLWISSNGVAIIIPSELPIIVSFNQTNSHELCLKSYGTTHDATVQYKIIVGADVKHLATHILSTLPKATDIPPTTQFEKPTWSVYLSSRKIYQLETYTKKILSHGFNGSSLLFHSDYLKHFIKYEIADPYFTKQLNDGYVSDNQEISVLKTELHYIQRRGMCPTVVLSLRMTPKGLDIPNIGFSSDSEMNNDINKIHRMNVRHSDKKRYHTLLSNIHGMDICSVALKLTHFSAGEVHNNIGGINDETNYDAKDALKFQTSNARNLHMVRAMVNHTLSDFSNALIAHSAASPWMTNFILMDDRALTWEALGSILPDAFSLGIAGYPFLMAPGLVLPNTTEPYPQMDQQSYMQFMQSHTGQLDAELYTRWMQLVALFPAIHIHLPPWLFTKQVVDHIQKILRIRQNYLPIILKAAQSATHTGLPIIQPIWMVAATTDPAVIAINDQFCIANDILVAPVLHKSTRRRRVYLPPGEWRDSSNSKTFQGPQWLSVYPVDLEHLPVFTRIIAEEKEEG